MKHSGGVRVNTTGSAVLVLYSQVRLGSEEDDDYCVSYLQVTGIEREEYRSLEEFWYFICIQCFE